MVKVNFTYQQTCLFLVFIINYYFVVRNRNILCKTKLFFYIII